jgi:hypothetical protein
LYRLAHILPPDVVASHERHWDLLLAAIATHLLLFGAGQ